VKTDWCALTCLRERRIDIVEGGGSSGDLGQTAGEPEFS